MAHPSFHLCRFSHFITRRHLIVLLSFLLIVAFFGAFSNTVYGQSAITAATGKTNAVPLYLFVIAAAFSMLIPAGFVLLCLAGLDAKQAWDTALGGVGAIGLAAFGYWATGFALQFGGIGLVYPHEQLRALVWEWSPFAADWGVGWGVAGLSGWFLSGADVTALAYALFLAHLPWAMTSALLLVLALRGRAPAVITLLLALLVGGVIYPIAGNWVQGGGWLASLGRNMDLGHGLVDLSGAGGVHLLAAGLSLAALSVWSPRRNRQPQPEMTLPAAELPVLAVTGSLLLFAGAIGWQWSNPLQIATLNEMAMLRGAVNVSLFASGGVIAPLLYTWFVTGRSEAMMSARGVAAGIVAGMAGAPFMQPGMAFLVGLLAGASVPFITYLTDALLGMDDATGAVSISGVPAFLGLLLTGLFADGAAGLGWQMTGLESHLGVTGQGVSGLLVATGYQPDFPGQLQAQVIGGLALGLWGFVAGLVVCAPLGLLAWGLQRSSARRDVEMPPLRRMQRAGFPAPAPQVPPFDPAPESEFEEPTFGRTPLRDPFRE